MRVETAAGAMTALLSAAACDDEALLDAHSPPANYAVVSGSDEPARVVNVVELGGFSIEVTDINGSGVAVGSFGEDRPGNPVVWTNGQPTQLPVPVGTSEAYPLAINDAGQIVGWGSIVDAGVRRSRGFLWSGGDVTVLEPPSGVESSSASDINASGEVVGTVYTESGTRAVVWRGGVPVQLPAAPGDVASDGMFINDSGLILGLSNASQLSKRFAVWEGNELVWVDADGRLPSHVLYHWSGISNAGLGYASYNIAGDTIYVWDDGQIRTIAGGASEELHVEDVGPDGLLVGRFAGVWGVWTEDGVFRPWDDTQVDRCTRIAANRWVACVRLDDWFVAQLEAFGSSTPTVESILTFFDDAVEAGTLEGFGPGASGELRRGSLRSMLEEARAMIEDGAGPDEICGQLAQVFRRTDGATSLPDFVAGPAAPDLAERVQVLMNELGCA